MRREPFDIRKFAAQQDAARKDDEKTAEESNAEPPAEVSAAFARADEAASMLEEPQQRGGLFGRINAALQDVIQSGRGPGQGGQPGPQPATPTPSSYQPQPMKAEPRRATPVAPQSVEPAVVRQPVATATSTPTDDLSLRKARPMTPVKMVIPEGVVISGSITCNTDADIYGRVDGDVIVETKLLLGPTAVVTGNVRTAYCRIEGLVEGKTECSQELELAKSGRLNADAKADKKVVIAGQLTGGINSSGSVRLMSGARMDGDIQAREFVIEEGAVFNGSCSMRTPQQRS